MGKLKAKHPKALLTVTDLEYITHLYARSDHEDNSDDPEAEWAQDDSDGESEGDSDVALVADADLAHIEESLTEAAFLHSINVGTTKEGMIGSVHAYFGNEAKEKGYNGICVDICCNRKSVMSLSQYSSYCSAFGLMTAIKTTTRTILQRIGGKGIPIGTARIQIPFTNLRIIIDVDFLILKEEVPSLLRMRDMAENRLEISITHCHISFHGHKQDLVMENFFLIHRWRPNELPYELYTERELRISHRSFGHPSVKKTKVLLRRASRGSLSSVTMDAIEQIGK